MDKLQLDSDVHELRLGRTFVRNADTAFHSMRYDFKPASVDTRQVASVTVGENSSVTVGVPHVEGAGTRETVYKGNKRPSQKECVLIIDHNTGEFTLEKLSSAIQLKKTRIEGSSRIRPSTPVEQLTKSKQEVKQSPVKKPPPHNVPPQAPQNPAQPPHNAPLFTQNTPVPSISSQPLTTSNISMGSPSASSNSSSSADSDSSDSEGEQTHPTPAAKPTVIPDAKPSAPRVSYHSTLSEDLQLSESGSDSD